jgi:hypothetical protein
LCTERTKSPKRSGVGAQVQVYSRSRRRPAPSVVEGCRCLVTRNHRPRTTRRADERDRRRRSAAVSCLERQCKLLRFYLFSLTFLVDILTPLHLERDRGEVPRASLIEAGP